MKTSPGLIFKMLLVLAWIFSAPGPAGSSASEPQFGETQGLTLPSAVELAMRNHPLLRAAQSGREIFDAQIEEARALRWPTVQFSGTFT